MGDVGNVLVAGCGIGVVCCGSVLLAAIIMTRVLGRAVMLPMIMPVISALGGQLLGFGKDADVDEELEPPRKRKRRPLDAGAVSASAQSDRDSFDEALARQRGDGSFDAQSSASPKRPPQSGLGSELSGGGFDKSYYGVRDASNDPNRVIRDRRYRRNFEDVDTTADNLSESSGIDFSSDAPSLRSDRRSRGRRRSPEDKDDEIFGGMLDDDGDGFSDF
jgi:hypothetical protein